MTTDVVAKNPTEKPASERSVALVCANFNMQSAFGVLTLALNSARLGYRTAVYFTFEGLNMLRPGFLKGLRYYPTGVCPAQPEVEKHTMELRELMDKRDIPYCEDMLQMAQYEGVKFLACKTSVELFNLGLDDLIPHVEIMNAEDFMRKAVDSDLHMMM